jgi:hypothetical protein
MTRAWDELYLGGGNEEIVSAPMAAHGLLIICGRRGAVYFINRFTGEILSETKLASGFELNTAPMVHGSTLLLGASDSVIAVDLLASFKLWHQGGFRAVEQWRVQLPDGVKIVRPITVAFDRRSRNAGYAVIAALKENQTRVFLLDVMTGRMLREQPWEIPALVSMMAGDSADNLLSVGNDARVYRLHAGEEPELTWSAPCRFPVNISVAPGCLDDTLFFFSEQGLLCSCQAGPARLGVLSQVSEARLLGVRAFAASRRGCLVAHGKGLSKLSLSGRLIWSSDATIEPMQSSPIIAGACGIGVSSDPSVAYVCDFQSASLEFHEHRLNGGKTRTPPALA